MKWIAGILVMLVAGWLGSFSFLFLTVYLLALLYFGNRWWTLAGLNQLVVRATLAANETEIGETVSRRVQITNAGRWSVAWVLIEDLTEEEPLIQVPARLRLSERRLHLARLKPGETMVFDQKIECLVRGYYRFGPVLVESGDLFGFHRICRIHGEPQFLTVFPRAEPLRDFDFSSRKRLGEVRITHRLFEDPSRICGIRPYEPGDPMNRIDWKASARVGALHSRNFDPTTLAGATLLLDFQQESFPPASRARSSELALDATIALAEYLCLRSKKVGLISNATDSAEKFYPRIFHRNFESRAKALKYISETTQPSNPCVKIPTLNRPDQLQRFRDLLARIELSNGKSFAGLTMENASEIPRDASVLAILCEIRAEEHGQALHILKQRGCSVSVILIQSGEPKHFDWAEGTETIQILHQIRVPFRIVSNAAGLRDLCSRDQLGLHL